MSEVGSEKWACGVEREKVMSKMGELRCGV